MNGASIETLQLGSCFSGGEKIAAEWISVVSAARLQRTRRVAPEFCEAPETDWPYINRERIIKNSEDEYDEEMNCLKWNFAIFGTARSEVANQKAEPGPRSFRNSTY